MEKTICTVIVATEDITVLKAGESTFFIATVALSRGPDGKVKPTYDWDELWNSDAIEIGPASLRDIFDSGLRQRYKELTGT
jgi:hypothetical protein